MIPVSAETNSRKMNVIKHYVTCTLSRASVNSKIVTNKTKQNQKTFFGTAVYCNAAHFDAVTMILGALT